MKSEKRLVDRPKIQWMDTIEREAQGLKGTWMKRATTNPL